MSEHVAQTLKNHVRFHPPFHYILTPILLLHFAWRVRALINDPGVGTAESVMLAFGLVVMGVLSRTNALKAQDRLIRLEEQLRYSRVLPATLAAKASALPVPQIVALRFAPDEELAVLVDQVISGQLVKPADIKKAIKNWRGDYYRV